MLDVSKRIENMVRRVRRAEELGLITEEEAEERCNSLLSLETLHAGALMTGDLHRVQHIVQIMQAAAVDVQRMTRWA